MIRKLKIVDKEGSIDAFYLLAYVSIICGVVNSFAFPLVELLTALLSLCVITYRDEVIRAKELPIEELKKELEKIKSELSELQITTGLRR